MPYYDEQSIATVDEALQQLTVSDLKQLAALLPTKNKPTRKAELVEFVKPHLLIPVEFVLIIAIFGVQMIYHFLAVTMVWLVCS